MLALGVRVQQLIKLLGAELHNFWKWPDSVAGSCREANGLCFLLCICFDIMWQHGAVFIFS